jgi:hypothetical protein
MVLPTNMVPHRRQNSQKNATVAVSGITGWLDDEHRQNELTLHERCIDSSVRSAVWSTHPFLPSQEGRGSPWNRTGHGR